MIEKEIKPISVGRWPWHDDVIHWTWRDSQEHHFNGLRVRRNSARLVAAFLLAYSGVLAVGLVRWITF